MAKKAIETDAAEFGQAIFRLVRRMRMESASHGLSWTEASVLVRLSKDGPATTAELARAEGVKPQSMGTIIATLEEMGMVERKPHPTDGRQVIIELTAKGTDVRNSARQARRTWLVHAMEQLSEDERAALFSAGKIIKRLVES